jgi:site-specific DNA-methyltransferase (adenine-specific)
MAQCLDDFVKISVAGATVFHGSNLDVLPFMADNSVDSIVTDPPYELGFMGKKWDSSGIAYSVELWRECLRVLKPGGHLLAFGGSRTWHRLAVAIEDAGFDVRDSIAWLYGSGFPKSHDVSKAIDKAAGALREVIGQSNAVGMKSITKARVEQGYRKNLTVANERNTIDITAPATDDAKKWAGWGTALKPAFEPVVVARKPLVGTVAENVLAWGVGGLNIDASRIAGEIQSVPQPNTKGGVFSGEQGRSDVMSDNTKGRWPANIILDEYTAGLLDEQSGQSKSIKSNRGVGFNDSGVFGSGDSDFDSERGYVDSGGASRFFYVSKANKRDRNEGDVPNTHPTVKPTDLMRYLIKLVTPAGGIVLDPFTGSGSTGKAALLDGYQFIGIELTADYLPIIEGRLQWAEKTRIEQAEALVKETEERLF